MWIDELKEGDLVVIRDWSCRDRTATVQKITPKGFIRVNNVLYDKKGYRCGRDIWGNHLCEATEELIRSIKDKEIILRAYDIMSKVNNITAEQAKKVIEILNPDTDVRKGEE